VRAFVLSLPLHGVQQPVVRRRNDWAGKDDGTLHLQLTEERSKDSIINS
jgi:hypothetical protein